MRRLVFLLLISFAWAAPVWETPNPAPTALRLMAEDVRTEAAAAEGPVAETLKQRAGFLVELAEELELGRKREAEARVSRVEVEREAEALAARERLTGPPGQPTAAGLRQLEGEVEAARRAVEVLGIERSRMEARRESLPRRLEEARQRAQTATARALALEEAVAPDEVALSAAQAENARLEARLAEERVRAITAEEGERSAAELLDNRLDLAERRLRLLSTELAAYRASIERQLTDERTRLAAAVLVEEKAAAAAVDPFDRFVGAERVRLARAELEVAELERARLDLERDLSFQRDRLVVERGELDAVRTAIERDPSSSYTAVRLKETFQRLQRRQQSRERDIEASVLAQVGAARARRLDVGDALAALNERWREDARALVDAPGLKPADRLQRHETLDDLRDRVRGALRDQSATLTAFIAAGEALRSVLVERGEVFAELDQRVRTRIFWIQDAPRLWSDLQENLGAELGRVLSWVARLQDDATASALSAMTRDPLELLLVLCIVVGLPLALFLTRRRFARLLARPTETRGDRIQRVAVGLVFASLTPLSLLLAELIVGGMALPGYIRPVLQALLIHLALSLWAWALVRLLLARDGVLVRHFGVRAGPVHEAASVLQPIIAGYAISLLPQRLLRGEPLHATTLAHLGVFAFGFVVLLAAARLFRQRGLLLSALARAFGDQPDRASLARPFRVLVLLAIMLILVMDTLGYRYGAERLAWGGFLSLLVVVPLSLIRPAATEAWRRWRASEGEPLPPAPRWMRPIFVGVGLLLLALVWGVDQGAVRLLEGIRLYSFDAEKSVTLLDLLGALLALAFTIWLVNVLPRLLRATVYPYFTLDDGLQYAITTISRYLLFFIGLVAVINVLGLGLGRLSWLMAALGVGIGFGLQEIVSNFVSGVILLLERPIRVGDFISVGLLEGRVLHINIRATTLLSLDRREIILPNKDLITKEVTNWTGTDRIIRITLPIHVAYGTDVDHLTRVLLEVAAAEPVVVTDPAPDVILNRHGSNGLEFELRIHVPDPWIRFRAQDRVNKAISRAFITEGIQFALPQQDLHIKSGVLLTRRVEGLEEVSEKK